MIDLLDLFAPGATWPEKHPETGEELVSVDAIVGGGEVLFLFHGASAGTVYGYWDREQWRWQPSQAQGVPARRDDPLAGVVGEVRRVW